jgi:hypothetical protein
MTTAALIAGIGAGWLGMALGVSWCCWRWALLKYGGTDAALQS